MTGRIQALTLALVGLVAAAPGAAQDPRGKPLGKWERKVSKSQVTLTVEESRLHLAVAGEKDWTIHADYSMTSDHVLYGMVTSVEGADEEQSVEKDLMDVPFSCRFRVDEGVLIVRDLKVGGTGKEAGWEGHFKMAVPSPPQPPRTAQQNWLDGPHSRKVEPPPPQPAPVGPSRN